MHLPGKIFQFVEKICPVRPSAHFRYLGHDHIDCDTPRVHAHSTSHCKNRKAGHVELSGFNGKIIDVSIQIFITPFYVSVGCRQCLMCLAYDPLLKWLLA